MPLVASVKRSWLLGVGNGSSGGGVWWYMQDIHMHAGMWWIRGRGGSARAERTGNLPAAYKGGRLYA